MDQKRIIYTVIQNDLATLKQKNITSTQIIDKISSILAGYHKQQFRIIGGNLVANLYQTCPLCQYEEGGSTIRTIINKRTGESISVETFLPHLIRVHNFFLDPSNRCRIDPAHAITVLNIQPNVDYGEKLRYVDSHITTEDMYEFNNEDDDDLRYRGIKPNWLL